MNYLKKLVVFAVLLIALIVGLSFLRPTGNVSLEIQSVLNNNLSSCQEINTSGVYILNTDILNENVSFSGCFNVSVSDVEIDCLGHSIINSSIAKPGIYASEVRNITIKNCNIRMSKDSGGYAIYFSNINSSSILNNNLSLGYLGLYLNSVYNTNIKNNIIKNNLKDGLYLESGSGNTIQNNTALSNEEGITLNLSSGNSLISNTINSNGLGISLLRSSNNSLTSNSISNCNRSCLSLIGSSSNNIFFGAINISNADLISIYDFGGDYSSNNLFKNTILSGASSYVVNLSKFSSSSTNNTFLNVSSDITKEFVNSGNELLKKLYYRLLVNTTRGGLVQNANVTVYNLTGGIVLSVLTDSNGLIPVQELTFYRNTGSQIYTNNYSIVASNVSLSANHTINLTDNLLTDFLTFNITVVLSLTNSTNTTTTSNTTTANVVSADLVTQALINSSVTPATENSQSSSQPNIYSASREQLEGGYEQELGAGDKIVLNLSDESHTIRLDQLIFNVSDYIAFIEISSDPINLTILVGGQKKVDLNSDGYYDLLIGLNNVTYDDKAQILVMAINESVVKEFETGTGATTLDNTEETPDFLSMLWKKMQIPLFAGISSLHITLVVVFIVLLILGYIFILKKRGFNIKSIFGSKHLGNKSKHAKR